MRDLNNYDEFMAFLADALEPFAVICADAEVANAFRSGGRMVGVASLICRKFPTEIATVLSAIEGISADEFKAKFSPILLVQRVSDLLKSDAIKQLFASAQSTEGASQSVSVQGNTVE